jgi:transcriptional regulator with XRE-family HTH domain
MGRPSAHKRSGSRARRGRVRANGIGNRLAVALREARAIDRVTQQEAADRSGISQARWSELERGLGASASVETWAIAASAVGMQLAAFLEGVPGADRPRDIEHARRQAAVIDAAVSGGWRALPELALDPAARSRSADVALTRELRGEAVATEIWDWFDDIGASFRGLDAKKQLLADRLRRDFGGAATNAWRVAGLFVVRNTARNRALVRELRSLFVARFTASSAAWLRTLANPDAPMPDGDGLLWSDLYGRLTGSHLRRRG